jgi:hypothetical protein
MGHNDLRRLLQLVINIGNMAGNIFLNMFLLGLVEGPGCILGVVLADKVPGFLFMGQTLF